MANGAKAQMPGAVLSYSLSLILSAWREVKKFQSVAGFDSMALREPAVDFQDVLRISRDA